MILFILDEAADSFLHQSIDWIDQSIITHTLTGFTSFRGETAETLPQETRLKRLFKILSNY